MSEHQFEILWPEAFYEIIFSEPGGKGDEKCLQDKSMQKNSLKSFRVSLGNLLCEFTLHSCIGSNPNLVLHGGGNTSIKLKQKNILGEEQEVLFVKASGADLANMTPEGFVALDLSFLRKLHTLDSLEDEEMESQLEIHKLLSRI